MPYLFSHLKSYWYSSFEDYWGKQVAENWCKRSLLIEFWTTRKTPNIYKDFQSSSLQTKHIMTKANPRANLNKSELLVKNTTSTLKYILVCTQEVQNFTMKIWIWSKVVLVGCRSWPLGRSQLTQPTRTTLSQRGYFNWKLLWIHKNLFITPSKYLRK